MLKRDNAGHGRREWVLGTINNAATAYVLFVYAH